jgi:hypothetical protein
VALDPITETIAHFIGFFDMAVEEARGRLEYDEFRALKAKAEDDAELATVNHKANSPYELTDVDPDLRYHPFDQSIVELQAASYAGGYYHRAGDVDIDAPSDEHSPSFFGDFIAMLSMRTEYILPSPGSTAVVAQQYNHLYDNDFVTMTDADVDLMPLIRFDAGVSALSGQAAALNPIGELAKPGSEAAISELVAEIAEIVESAYGVEAPGETQAKIALGGDAGGTHVNGIAVDEAPLLSDYMPDDEEEEDDTGSGVSFAEGEGTIIIDNHVELETGANTLVNEALIANTWIVAPVIAVEGDAIDIDIISQVNVWCDADSIGAQFSGWLSQDAAATAAFNIAAITSDMTTPETAEPEEEPGGFPTQWTVTRLDGNLVFLDWIDQYSFVSDHDATVLTHAGSETMIETGGNTVYNSFSLFQLGNYFDLVVAGGGYYHANVIDQTNVLLDNDFMWGANGFSSSGDATVSTGGNLLWNQAKIHTVGQTQFEEMPDHYFQAAQSLGSGNDNLPGGVLGDGAFAGFGALNVLYIDGSILNMQYIRQTNILGDSDQIAMFGDALTGDLGTGWTIDTGSNHLINIATIVDAGIDSTVYAGGEIYSDALLYQAELISDDPLGAMDSSSDLASEAVVFLADGMLEDDYDDTDMSYGPTAPDAPHVDVMQTMLA